MANPFAIPDVPGDEFYHKVMNEGICVGDEECDKFSSDEQLRLMCVGVRLGM
jgi:hypothetical protein